MSKDLFHEQGLLMHPFRAIKRADAETCLLKANVKSGVAISTTAQFFVVERTLLVNSLPGCSAELVVLTLPRYCSFLGERKDLMTRLLLQVVQEEFEQLISSYGTAAFPPSSAYVTLAQFKFFISLVSNVATNH